MRIFNKKAQKGASLLEVLIALFVLAVGLLGVLSLQAESLRFNQQAHSASQALFLANDLVERMRLNTKGEYATNQATPLVGVNPCKTNSCDSAALASADLAEWASNIAARLPGGLGNVSSVAGASQGKRYKIEITYQQVVLENESKTEPTSRTYSLDVAINEKT